jgi:hypothetical protein
MTLLFDHAKLIVSKKAFEFDGHKVTYSVTERTTGRLVGHVAKTSNARYGRRYGSWCYLLVTDPRGTWTLGGWTREDAVDHLMSAFSPCGIFTGELV